MVKTGSLDTERERQNTSRACVRKINLMAILLSPASPYAKVNMESNISALFAIIGKFGHD